MSQCWRPIEQSSHLWSELLGFKDDQIHLRHKVPWVRHRAVSRTDLGAACTLTIGQLTRCAYRGPRIAVTGRTSVGIVDVKAKSRRLFVKMGIVEEILVSLKMSRKRGETLKFLQNCMCSFDFRLRSNIVVDWNQQFLGGILISLQLSTNLSWDFRAGGADKAPRTH